MVSGLGPEETDWLISEVVDSSSNNLKVDLSLFFGGIKDVRQECDNAERNIESNAVLVPFIFTCKSLDQEAFVLLYFFQGPFFEGIRSPGTLV